LRILFVSQWFEPEFPFKGLDFAKELVGRGHQVEVLTGFPNYPGGRVYPGYRVRWRQRETMEGIPVTRVALYPSHDRSGVRRAANYLSFAASAATVGAASVSRADVAYVYHPPATIAFPAAVLKALRGVPFVLDVQDLWPDTLAATGMVKSRAVLGAVGRFCAAAYRSAARVVVPSPGFRQALLDRGVPDGKIGVIYNWCRRLAVAGAQPGAPVLKEAGVDGRFNVVFAGAMGPAQALDSVLDAAAAVQAQEPRVQFVFAGGGVARDALERRAAGMRLGNVKFLGHRPPGEIAPLLAAADVLLVHLRDDPLFSITIPSKTQDAMASGRPILMAVRGDGADLVRAAGAGVCVGPEDPAALAGAVCELSRLAPAALEAMGARGRAYYERHLSMSAGADRFEALFREVAGAA
jgi:glycosyltransferase involved in cell wall biosynthesis